MRNPGKALQGVAAEDMELQELFAGMPVDPLAAGLSTGDIPDLTLDSREVVPGGLFLAVSGQACHGLDFAAQAAAAGAGAIVWEPTADGAPADPRLPAGVPALAVPGLKSRLGELADRFFASPSARVEVAGITGTNGKTTTAWLLVQALEWLGSRTGYLGTLGAGLGTAVQPGTLTTPDCITFHRRLRSLADGGARRVVAEVSSHALDQDRVAGVRFTVVAFTNLSRDHLDYHGDLDHYGAAKARLFQGQAAAAVINTGDAFGRRLAAELPRDTRLVRVAVAPGDAGADIVAAVKELSPAGLTLALSGTLGTATLRSPLWGRFNAENLVVATGMLVALGYSLPQAAAALAGCTAPPGRLERVGRGMVGKPAVVVDFAHTPDALEKVLTALREHCTGRLWCVFGCGGNRDAGKRAPMGAVAARLADQVVLTSDNPRDEDPGRILADILAGVPDRRSVRVQPDRARAIREAIGAADAGDVVLIAGKGHETVQVEAGETRPFSDQAVALEALGEAVPGVTP
jgi:UDP-N-acetylmuramoyl-L-alanyl-D-glutamate--2,6-diaminopimelate ligase